MSTVTDSDLQQIKDLITSGQLATQQQIAELAASTQRQITDGQLATQQQIAELDKKMEVGFAEVKGEIKEVKAEIKGIHTELENIKSNQKAQDTRFWSLVFLIITTLIGSIGAIGRIAKLY